jgi:acyl-CoA thioester hydrolase
MSSSNNTHSFSHRLRVRYADTDLQGHVYFGSYYTYLDEALMALLRQLGYSWQQLAARGLEFYYAESHCSYSAPCYAEEKLDIRVGFDKLGTSSLRSWMTIYRPDGQVAARGFITAVMVAAESGRPTPLPDDLRALIAAHIEEDP